MTCPHCGRGAALSHIATAMVLGSVVLGAFAGIAIGLPYEGAAFGLLHAVVPVGWFLEESNAAG